MTALLSVVVPVYGVAADLAACLRSLIGPTPGVEVIAVDDASPDSSGAVLDRFPEVHTVHLPSNVGLGAARNIGLSLATGAYVWFVDGDDLLAAGALPRVLDVLRDRDPDVLLVGHALLSGRWVLADPSSVPSGPSDVVSLRERPALTRVRQAAWNRIVRVDLLRRTGLRFPDGLYEDVAFSHLVLACARRIAVLDEVCYLYRTRPFSTTRTPGPRHFEVFTQYDRLFATLSSWQASPRLRARVHARMVAHYLAILGAPDRIPPALRRAFFTWMVAHERRYRPVGGAPPGPPASVTVRLGWYRAYRVGHLARRVWPRSRDGKDLRMTEPAPDDVVDDGVSDVLAEDEVVQVSPAAAELAETLDHEHASTFVAEVPDWNSDDPLPAA